MATEDYKNKPLLFKLRKVFRYVQIYGFNRTLIKVRSQLHMSSQEGFQGVVWQNGKCHDQDADERNVGIIGCGSFSFCNIAYYLNKKNKKAIRGAMDINASRARSLIKHYKGAYATVSADELINDPKISLIYIASNHSTHATFAVEALKAGKDVHIEKPQVVSMEQLAELTKTLKEHPNRKVFLGYNRPKSQLFKILKKELDKQSGASMINWFVAGHEINDDHWYFDKVEGGRILGNLCHWSDLTLQLVGLENVFPLKITPNSPVNSKSDFVTSIQFGDDSMAAITFSAKGHTFEGVREVLNIHKGDLLGNITDFKSITLDIGSTKIKKKKMFRDHGHRKNIIDSYDAVLDNSNYGVSSDYNTVTAKLFLAIAKAHQSQKEVFLKSIDSHF